MTIQHNLKEITDLMEQAALESKRSKESVLLLAVSKQQNTDTLRQAYALGLHHFGESYLQEALPKINALADLAIDWHFIGPIQSNKTQGIANHFTWVHSVSRLKIALQLNEYRPAHLPPLNICLQINLVNEASKSGVAPEEAMELARAISQLPRLNLRGLMTIPPPETDPHKQYHLFMQLNQLMHSLNNELNLKMDTLSMGMSDDFCAAIQAGATIIRIGRGIFAL